MNETCNNRSPDVQSSSEDYLHAHTVGELRPLSRPIAIVDYDSGWPHRFELETAKIQSALGGRALLVEHVGSTSVPGLPAKAIIDIVLVVADSSREDQYAPALEAAGYRLRIREPAWYEHRLFEGPEENVNLHVFSLGCPEIDRMLAFRDWLRTSEEDRELYARSKRELARRDWKYTQDYADAKTAVVQEILSRARHAESLYREDLAYIHATAFSGLAHGAAPEIVRLLRSATIPIRKVVDLGCGAGPLTAALSEAGFEVTGIDSSAALLSLARTAVPNTRFVNASIYDAEIPACEAVLAVGEPLTYHAERADADHLLENLFRRLSATLPPGGMFIFDVVELGEPSLAGRSWSCGDDWAVLVETTEDQGSRVLVRNIETFRRIDRLYRRAREVHKVRLFDAQALSEQLTACGFAIATAQAYGAQPLAPRRRAWFCTRV